MINLNVNQYSLLRPEEPFAVLNDGQLSPCKLDFSEAYLQIELDNDSKKYVTRTLVTHIIYLEWQIDVKLSKIVKLLFFIILESFKSVYQSVWLLWISK